MNEQVTKNAINDVNDELSVADAPADEEQIIAQWKTEFSEHLVSLGCDKDTANAIADEEISEYGVEILEDAYDPIEAANNTYDEFE